MKLLKALVLILSMLTLFNGCSNTHYSVEPSSLPSLRFDGIYQSEVVVDGDSQMWHYVRFYEDYTVLTVWSIGTPAEIISWFKKENIENGNFSHGQYEIKDSQLIFSATSKTGTVDYEGTFENDVLTLNWHSHINGNSGTNTYTFVEISEK